MAVHASRKRLALDTNLVLDLAGEADFAHEFREVFHGRGYSLHLPPTVLGELHENFHQGAAEGPSLRLLQTGERYPASPGAGVAAAEATRFIPHDNVTGSAPSRSLRRIPRALEAGIPHAVRMASWGEELVSEQRGRAQRNRLRRTRSGTTGLDRWRPVSPCVPWRLGAFASWR